MKQQTNFGACASIAIALLLPGCAYKNDVVELRGHIDSYMATIVSDALDAGHRDFTINSSTGGLVVYAEAMAARLAAASASLTVNGTCLSACALMLLGVTEKYATADADIEIHGGWAPGQINEAAARLLTGTYMAQHGIPAGLAFGRGDGMNLYRLTSKDMATAGIRQK